MLSNVGLGFQNYGGFVKVEWPIFDGGLDSNKIKAAESSWREAKEAVLLAWVKSIADVMRAYTSVKAALARRESAEALQTASKAACGRVLISASHRFRMFSQPAPLWHRPWL